MARSDSEPMELAAVVPVIAEAGLPSSSFVIDEQERLAEAIGEYEAVLEGRRRILGQDDDNTVRTMSDLAIALAKDGQLDRAETALRQLLDQHRRRHGDQHPHTLTAWRELIFVLSRLERFDEAAREYKAMWQAAKDAEHGSHPDDSNAGPADTDRLQSPRHPPVT